MECVISLSQCRFTEFHQPILCSWFFSCFSKPALNRLGPSVLRSSTDGFKAKQGSPAPYGFKVLGQLLPCLCCSFFSFLFFLTLPCSLLLSYSLSSGTIFHSLKLKLVKEPPDPGMLMPGLERRQPKDGAVKILTFQLIKPNAMKATTSNLENPSMFHKYLKGRH